MIQTDLTARTFRSALVGLCRVCNVYTEPKEGTCPFDCTTLEYSARLARQVTRRMLICSKCEMCFTTQEGAEEHDCYSFY